MQTMVTIAQIVYEASVEIISVVMYLYDKKIYIYIFIYLFLFHVLLLKTEVYFYRLRDIFKRFTKVALQKTPKVLFFYAIDLNTIFIFFNCKYIPFNASNP